MTEKKPIFDIRKAQERIANGKRANWWQRKGLKSKGFRYFDKKGKESRRAARQYADSLSKLVYSSDSFKILRTGITLDEFSEKKNRKVKRIQAEYELKEIALMKLFKLMDK